MTPADIWDHLEPIFALAKKLLDAFENNKSVQAKKLQEASQNQMADTPTLRVPSLIVGAWYYSFVGFSTQYLAEHFQ